jgi:hypothetical protein
MSSLIPTGNIFQIYYHHVNLWAILIGFVYCFIANGIWFGPKTMYPIWVKARGGHNTITSDSKDINQLRLFGSTAIALLLQVVSISFIVTLFKVASFGTFSTFDGAAIGFVLGLGISAFSSLGHRLFGGENFKSWAIECGIDVINMTVVGILIAVMH